MKQKTTDIKKIRNHKCSNCTNKSTGLINKVYYCERCYKRIKPPKEDMRIRRPSWYNIIHDH